MSRENPKLILVFAFNRRTFDSWVVNNLFPGAFKVGGDIHAIKSGKEGIYKYAFNANNIRGINPSEIILLYFHSK